MANTLQASRVDVFEEACSLTPTSGPLAQGTDALAEHSMLMLHAQLALLILLRSMLQ